MKQSHLFTAFLTIFFSLSVFADNNWVLSYEVPITQSFNESFRIPKNQFDYYKMTWEDICQKRFANEVVRPDQMKVAYRFNFVSISENETVSYIRTNCDFAIINRRQ